MVTPKMDNKTLKKLKTEMEELKKRVENLEQNQPMSCSVDPWIEVEESTSIGLGGDGE